VIEDEPEESVEPQASKSMVFSKRSTLSPRKVIEKRQSIDLTHYRKSSPIVNLTTTLNGHSSPHFKSTIMRTEDSPCRSDKNRIEDHDPVNSKMDTLKLIQPKKKKKKTRVSL